MDIENIFLIIAPVHDFLANRHGLSDATESLI